MRCPWSDSSYRPVDSRKRESVVVEEAKKKERKKQPMKNEELEAASAATADCSSGLRAGAGSEDRVKGPWSPEEDAILSRLVVKFGARNWSLIARGISGRSGKSCRLRWCNQLDPGVKRKPFTGILNYPLILLFPLFIFAESVFYAVGWV